MSAVDQQFYEDLVAYLAQIGFNAARLELTPQPGTDLPAAQKLKKICRDLKQRLLRFFEARVSQDDFLQ